MFTRPTTVQVRLVDIALLTELPEVERAAVL